MQKIRDKPASVPTLVHKKPASCRKSGTTVQQLNFAVIFFSQIMQITIIDYYLESGEAPDHVAFLAIQASVCPDPSIIRCF